MAFVRCVGRVRARQRAIEHECAENEGIVAFISGAGPRQALALRVLVLARGRAVQNDLAREGRLERDVLGMLERALVVCDRHLDGRLAADAEWPPIHAFREAVAHAG